MAQSQRRLELVPTPRTTGVRVRPAALRAGARVVLVVEDSFLERKLVVAALRGAGLDAIGVSTVTEALVEVRTRPIALVLLDRHLPDGDGFDVAREMRDLPAARDVPIIALTGSTTRHDVDDALVAGCDGFLAKPCGLEKVVNAVREMLPAR